MTLTIRRADESDRDLTAIEALNDAVTPGDPTTVATMRWVDATYPGGARWIARLDGRAVGVATCGRIHQYEPGFDGYWATLHVLPDARRYGIGGELLAAAGGHALAHGKTQLHVPVSEHRVEAVAFLAHRGFTEYERSKSLRLALEGVRPPPVQLPVGVAFTTLRERPDLVRGVHEVAVATFAHVPGGDRPMDPGDLAEFRARDVDRPDIPADAFVIALATATGDAIGYASLSFVPGSSTVAWHDMTAVRPEWRGRGLARALKLTTIRWAIDHGLTTLISGNDEGNAPMRAINARLGYQPMSDELTMRGPATGGIIAT